MSTFISWIHPASFDANYGLDWFVIRLPWTQIFVSSSKFQLYVTQNKLGSQIYSKTRARLWSVLELTQHLHTWQHNQEKLPHFVRLYTRHGMKTFVFDLFLNINQLDALHFIISLFHASTCFEHMCSSSGGQIVLYSLWNHHTCRWSSRAQIERGLIKFSASGWLILRSKYIEMYGQQNI